MQRFLPLLIIIVLFAGGGYYALTMQRSSQASSQPDVIKQQANVVDLDNLSPASGQKMQQNIVAGLSLSEQDTPFLEAYYQAEQQHNTQQAISEWQKLLDQSKQRASDNFHYRILLNLLHAEWAEAKNNNSISQLEWQKSQQYIDPLPKHIQVWVRLYLLHDLVALESDVTLVHPVYHAALSAANDYLATMYQTQADNATSALDTSKEDGVAATKLFTTRSFSTYLYALNEAALVKNSSLSRMVEETLRAHLQHITTQHQRARLLQLAAKNGLFEKFWTPELRQALSASLDSRKERDDALIALYHEYTKTNQYSLALDALLGVGYSNEQDDLLLKSAESHYKAGDMAHGERFARLITDGRRIINGTCPLLKNARDLGYDTRALAYSKTMESAANTVEEPERRVLAYRDAGKCLAEAGFIDKAIPMLALSNNNSSFVIALIKALAEQGKPEQALEYIEEIEDQNLDADDASRFARARYRVAEALVKQSAAEAMSMLADLDTEKRYELADEARDKAYGTLARHLAQKEQYTEAMDASKRIDNLKYRAKILQIIHAIMQEKQAKKDDINKPLLQLQTLAAQQNPIYMRYYALALVNAGEVAEAETLHTKLQKTNLADALYINAALAAYRWKNAEIDADALANALQSLPTEHVQVRDAILKKYAMKLIKAHAIKAGFYTARSIHNNMMRVYLMRDMAKETAHYTDAYAALSTEGTMYVPGEIAPPKPQDINTKATRELKFLSANDVSHSKPEGGKLGVHIRAVNATGSLDITRDDLASALPIAHSPIFRHAYVDNEPYNNKFLETVDESGYIQQQSTVTPEIIYLESGVAELADLQYYLQSHGKANLLKEDNGVYTLRLPIVVQPGATLVISGAEVREFRLSSDHGSYIINAGTIHMIDTRIVAWRESDNKPAYANYQDQFEYRPFFTAWSRSQTYMAGSEMVGFGYQNDKSYGLSFSSGPNQLLMHELEPVLRPSAVIVDNLFDNMLYGFYSYEADNIVLIGNEYKNNIVYGIDPHDRSRWFTIAYNTAYDTEKKHGIIISREVNYSTILGNISFKNYGSGLMIDRQSSGTLIYGNTAFDNKQDGLTIFESSCKIVASNRFFDNKRSGVLVRNSVDVGVFFNVLSQNKRAGIQAYTSDLRSNTTHSSRDFELDPYTDVVAFSGVGNWLENNTYGIQMENVAMMLLSHTRFVKQAPKLFGGDSMALDISRLQAQYNLQEDGIVLQRKCPKAQSLHPEICSFRREGYLDGDGQAGLIDTVNQPNCVASTSNKEASL